MGRKRSVDASGYKAAAPGPERGGFRAACITISAGRPDRVSADSRHEPGTHSMPELTKNWRPPRPFRSPHTRRPTRHSPQPQSGRASVRRAPPRARLCSSSARPPRFRPSTRGGLALWHGPHPPGERANRTGARRLTPILPKPITARPAPFPSYGLRAARPSRESRPHRRASAGTH